MARGKRYVLVLCGALALSGAVPASAQQPKRASKTASAASAKAAPDAKQRTKANVTRASSGGCDKNASPGGCTVEQPGGEPVPVCQPRMGASGSNAPCPPPYLGSCAYPDGKTIRYFSGPFLSAELAATNCRARKGIWTNGMPPSPPTYMETVPRFGDTPGVPLGKGLDRTHPLRPNTF